MDNIECVRQKLAFWKKEIDLALEKHWRETEYLDIHKNEWIADSWEETKKIIMNGGKRLRPTLMLAIYELSGKKDVKKVIPIALALELLHNYFLVHDDIIDEDSLRHGTATLNEAYRQKADNFGRDSREATHFGNSIALLLGDRLTVEAIQLVLESTIPTEKKIAVIRELILLVNTTICGEELDVMVYFPASKDIKSTRQAVEEIIKNKTAYYSFVAPIKIGGILSDTREENLSIMKKIGLKLGEIFQWQDDYLGIFADEKTLGKPAGSDLREKKPTLLLLKTIENLSFEDKIKMRNLMGRPLSERELNKARELIQKSGAQKWMEDNINSTLKKMIASINSSRLNNDAKNFFMGLVAILINRKF